MPTLTPLEATHLFSSSSFILFLNLPPGSEVSIDSAPLQAINHFSGWKFVPPGIHLITYAPASSAAAPRSADPPKWGQRDEDDRAESMGLSLRRGVWRNVGSERSVIVLRYSAELEDLEFPFLDPETGVELDQVVDEAYLESIDGELAPYLLMDRDHSTKDWDQLSGCVSVELLRKTLGPTMRIDGLMESNLDEDSEVSSSKQRTRTSHYDAEQEKILIPAGGPRIEAEESKKLKETCEPEHANEKASIMQFPVFDLKRSWRSGAVGEEVTTFSQDKSWLLREVVRGECHNDPLVLLGYIQASFLIFLNVHNYSALLAFQRVLSLSCRSRLIISSPMTLPPSSPPSNQEQPSSSVPTSTNHPQNNIPHTQWINFFHFLLRTINAQLHSLPSTFFTVDSAGMGLEEYWIKEIESLIRNLRGVNITQGGEDDVVQQDKEQEKGRSNAFKAKSMVLESIETLRDTGRDRFGWDLVTICGKSGRTGGNGNVDGHAENPDEEEDDYEEEGDDAPVVVEF